MGDRMESAVLFVVVVAAVSYEAVKIQLMGVLSVSTDAFTLLPIFIWGFIYVSPFFLLSFLAWREGTSITLHPPLVVLFFPNSTLYTIKYSLRLESTCRLHSSRHHTWPWGVACRNKSGKTLLGITFGPLTGRKTPDITSTTSATTAPASAIATSSIVRITIPLIKQGKSIKAGWRLVVQAPLTPPQPQATTTNTATPRHATQQKQDGSFRHTVSPSPFLPTTSLSPSSATATTSNWSCQTVFTSHQHL